MLLQNIFEINKLHALHLFESHIVGDEIFAAGLERGGEMQGIYQFHAMLGGNLCGQIKGFALWGYLIVDHKVKTTGFS